MGKNKLLTTTFHVNGKQVEKLTEEQCEKIAQRLSEAMSIYYSNHLDEFLKLWEKRAAKKPPSCFTPMHLILNELCHMNGAEWLQFLFR